MDPQDKLKIAMIGTRGLPANYGGVETVVDVLSRELVRRGHDVTVFCRSEDYATQPPVIDGVKLIYLPASDSPGVGAMLHAFRASIYSIGRGFDVIHFHALGPGLMSLVSRAFSRATVVVTVHGRDDKRDKWGKRAKAILSVAARVSAKVPHATLVVSKALAAEYKEEFGRDTTVVPNSTHAIPARPAGTTLERFGLTAARYLVSVGRLVPEKAPHELIEAFDRSESTVPLLIVGGAAGTEDYVEELQQQYENSERIIFAGPLYGDELAEVLTNAGAFVTASHLEGLPTALIEAGRAGLPLLASDIPAHLEILDTTSSLPGRCIFETGNVNELTDVLNKVTANLDEERNATSDYAKNLDDRYAPPRTAEVHERAYLGARAR